MRGEDVAFLEQLISTLEQAMAKLEDAYVQGNSLQVNSVKRLVMQIQTKIAEIVE